MKKNHSYILFGLLLSVQISYCQNNNDAKIYNWFDKNVGIESLELINGTGHSNFDKTAKDQNRYYKTDKFTKGSVNFNNQDYYNLELKYDIYFDEVVLRPFAETDYIQVNLLKDKIVSFKIEDQIFANLKQIPKNFKGGYYEEIILGSNSALYIKYYKEKKEIVKDNFFLTEYNQMYDFVLFKDNQFILINDKNEIIKSYPNQKSKINDFYSMDKKLRKDDPASFMKKLMKYINNFNL